MYLLIETSSTSFLFSVRSCSFFWFHFFMLYLSSFVQQSQTLFHSTCVLIQHHEHVLLSESRGPLTHSVEWGKFVLTGVGKCSPVLENF